MSLDFRQCEFLLSVAHLRQLPPGNGPEAAFAGRSNAGKSSAINALTGRTRLARTSKTPGRTRQINFFHTGTGHHLVDLPGYGYARVSESMRLDWKRLVEGYLTRRVGLKGEGVLSDIRHPATDLDRQLLAWCLEAGVPVQLCLTKCDKLSRGKAGQVLARIVQQVDFAPHEGEVQLFSALRRTGVDRLRQKLCQWFEFA